MSRAPEKLLEDVSVFIAESRKLMAQGAFVLTRLHARYGKKDMKDDLRFQEAKGIVGGRELTNDKGQLEIKPVESSESFFQGRYAIRYPWKGAIRCKNPTRFNSKTSQPQLRYTRIATRPETRVRSASSPR